MPISIFGFQALWSPYLMGICVFLTIVYFLITITWRKDFKVSEPLKRSEAIYFVLGMLTLYIVKGSPIDLMGHIMFTWHMTQMAFLLLLVPIFIIKGIPWWVWKLVVEAPVIGKLIYLFTQPIVAIVLFTGLFSLYHMPLVFDFVKLDDTLHGIVTLSLFTAAMLMYWPLLNRIEGQRQLQNLGKLGYIAANAVLITPACALIIFASHPMYGTYSDGDMWLKAMELCVPSTTLSGLTLSGPELFSNMSLVGDQQVGGVLMKIIQEIIFGVILFKVFREWWESERKSPDEITANELKAFQNRNEY